MAKPIVIGITGMPASGKTVVAEYLNKKGGHRIHLGDFVWAFLKKRQIARTRETGMMAGLYFWAEYGDIPVADWAIKQIKGAKKKPKFFILDALRTMEERYLFMKEFGKNFKLIAVVAGPDVRFTREKARARFGEKIYGVDFRIRDREELTIGLGDVISCADYYIDANGPKKELLQQADEILKQIIK